MRSGEVCQCDAILDFPGTWKNTSTLFLDGSPCNTAIRHPLGRNSGQGPHLSDLSAATNASGGSPAGACARPVGEVKARAATEVTRSAAWTPAGRLFMDSPWLVVGYCGRIF